MDQCPGTDEDSGSLVLDNLGNPMIRFNDKSYPFYGMFNSTTGPDQLSVMWQGASAAAYIAMSGVAITELYAQTEGTLKTTINDMVILNSEDKFTNTFVIQQTRFSI